MPLAIIKKPVTTPKCPNQHFAWVPLRITSIRGLGDTHGPSKESVEVGDIIFTSGDYSTTIINATKSRVVDSRWNERILCVRAYEIAQIVLTNDNEPAPIFEEPHP